MERSDSIRTTVNVTSAISGALFGATAGMIGGTFGAAAGGVAGALIGGLGALSLERRRHAPDVDEDVDDATWAAMIEPPRTDDEAWHTRQHPRARVHYAYPPTFARGWMFLRP